MFEFFKICFPYCFPEEGAGITDETLDPVDPLTDIGIIDEDDDKIEDEDEDKEVDENEDSDEEDEDEDEDEEEDDTESPVNFNELKTVLKDNPKLLKKLKGQFFREQEFSRIFSTPKDAENAANDAIRYQDLTEIVISGNVEKILNDIKEISPEALQKFTNNFLPALGKLDEKRYIQVTGPIIQGVLRAHAYSAKKANNTELLNAIEAVNKEIFDETVYEAPKQEVEDEKLKKDRAEFLQTKHNALMTEVVKETDKGLIEIIGDIDPTGLLKNKPRLKKRILDEIIDEVKDSLQKDEPHMANMGRLLEREKRNGFKGELKDSITKAFLSRAKVLVPTIRKKVRAEYLGSVKDSDVNTSEKVNGRDRHIQVGSESRRGNTKLTVKDARTKGMSDRDIIDS